MEKNSNYQQIKSEQNLDEEIDLINLISFFLRNKILIGTLAFFSFFIACLYSFTLKRVWEGQFQIVLNSDQDSKITSLNPAISDLIGSDQGNNNLKTQVGILKSPSVLMPIYDLVNKRDSKDKINKLPFYKWKNNLDIKLQKGTSILNIAYRDKNKEIILPALKKMSSIYQDYSEIGLKRGQQLTNEYLINQINLFREKSANSIKAAQNYAIDQNLIYLGKDELPNISNSIPDVNSEIDTKGFNLLFLGDIVNIENVRVAAANEIRKINLKIKKINELDPMDYENLQFFGSSLPDELYQDGLPQSLQEIEKELVFLRTQYTADDPLIIRLLEQRKLTVDLLKSRAIKYLKVAKLEAESTMEAAMRPKGVLLKYRELRREAKRDEETLFALENDLRILQLQQAKINDPWQLITQPTLLENPVAPSRKQISLIGLFLGALIGLLASFYKEKKSDKIFSLQQLQKLLYKPCLERIDKNEKFEESKEIMFFKEFLKIQNAKKIAFISLEENNRTYLKGLSSYLTDETDLNSEIEIISNQYSLEECKSVDLTILFTSLVHSSFKEIKSLNSRFDFLEVPFKGFILLY